MRECSVKINRRSYTFRQGMTILEAAMETMAYPQEFRRVEIPVLYYRKGVVDIDESGVCIVEADGKLVNASMTYIGDGMEIFTYSEKVVAARREALANILRTHHRDCLNCMRCKTCELQNLLHTYGFTDELSLSEDALEELDLTSVVLVRDNNKCIRCKRCINACAKLQAVSAIAATDDHGKITISPASPLGLSAASCVSCGQCVAVCPTGALTERTQLAEVEAALADPEKYVVAQVAPAVRAALGESFEFPIGCDVEGRIAGALRELGFDRVFDTTFGADLTVVEEANELVQRMEGGGVLPMFTSCCPAWVKYAEYFYPELIPHLSTCKSPHMMEGALIKSYFAQKEGIDRERIVVVSIMPCTGKKFEITRAKLSGDVDYVLTTNEIALLIQKAEIQFESMYATDRFDDPLGKGTGAGVIFGKSGGVLEAALRTAAKKTDVSKLRTVSVSGLANANALLQKIKRGEAEYDFIEIMACPGGCVNGGGQPHQESAVHMVQDVPKLRAQALVQNDEHSEIRTADENPSVQAIYEDFLECPGSEKAHELCHTRL